ncbi:ATP-binding protein [Streptomyces roseicoloratus]|uniref:ATP-binding protein n=1 Tax=Streptomyces roseicoloratus TaxID=2508722 RepID=A0ABY9S1G6_9ACTN|nr:ATP-binding protein [Streptomyces roseicoloratus]WMX48261.1 ATP-binding protein [Streptomyces roseicoloratus]
MISEPSRYCTVELQALPSRIGQVRRIVSAHLRHWQLDALIDHATLGVTELLTNVHQHAQPDKACTVEVELLLDRLTVSVRDNDPRIPDLVTERPDPTDEFATSGRGLAIIDAMSESWGVRPHGDAGKVVWFTLQAPAPAVDPAPRARVVHGATTVGPFADLPMETIPFGLPNEPVRTPATARPALTS